MNQPASVSLYAYVCICIVHGYIEVIIFCVISLVLVLHCMHNGSYFLACMPYVTTGAQRNLGAHFSLALSLQYCARWGILAIQTRRPLETNGDDLLTLGRSTLEHVIVKQSLDIRFNPIRRFETSCRMLGCWSDRSSRQRLMMMSGDRKQQSPGASDKRRPSHTPIMDEQCRPIATIDDHQSVLRKDIDHRRPSVGAKDRQRPQTTISRRRRG